MVAVGRITSHTCLLFTHPILVTVTWPSVMLSVPYKSLTLFEATSPLMLPVYVLVASALLS